MNTNTLRKFATAARRKLMTQVRAKLDYVLTADSPALREQAKALAQLRQELTNTTRPELVERVAYTWFNRFVALRFLDVNDYQPSGIRAVSPVDGFTTPQLLDEAKQGQIPDDLPVNTRRVMDLLDGRLPSRDGQSEAYQMLLTATCNALNGPLPFLFEPLADYTELLMPDDLLSPQSVLVDIREGMTADDCRNVEIIGWLYQFYISERKDAVFAAKSKVKAEDIPAATQLFTPRWVVEYLVQNTLGKLWLRTRPANAPALCALMPYYLESPSSESSPPLLTKERGPGGEVLQLTLLDPAAGSGHILVYAFDLLAHIYEAEGYPPAEIPGLILQHNLMGFDIDERAAQLANFALTMRARQLDRRFFRRGILPRVVALHKLEHGTETDWRTLLADTGHTYLDPMIRDLTLMTQADNLGALIRPETPGPALQQATDTLTARANQTGDLFENPLATALARALHQLALLTRQHTCVVANPPYMGGGAMNAPLSAFVKKYYPDSKADLMACFMESGLSMCQPGGYLGMINQHSWMFLTSYEDLRKKLIDSILIDTLLHLGPRTFPEIGGEVVQNAAFTFQNTAYTEPPAGTYVRLVDLKNTAEKAANVTNPGLTFYAKQDNFEKIPGDPFGYWLSDKVFSLFADLPKLAEIVEGKKGLSTSENDRFLRIWSEVSLNKITFIYPQKQAKWVPANKGGEFRKYYGNQEFIINWEHNGAELKALQPKSVIRSPHFYFLANLAWSKVSTKTYCLRYFPAGFIPIDAVSYFVPNPESCTHYVLAVLNSKVFNHIIGGILPTINYEIGDIAKLPISSRGDDVVDKITQSCVAISREDWDARETSWDFRQSELLRYQTDGSLQTAVETYETHWQGRFTQLHQHEEALNRIFIDLYGLQDELTAEVDPDDITILGQEAKPDPTGKLTFDRRELMAQFISYAVGCMFGRYSLDKAGLILASQGQTLADYAWLVADNEPTAHRSLLTFSPDADNIIPILDDDWFADDIVARFRAFVRAAFVGTEAEFAQNMVFIEECLGMDIRKWFTRHFYDDHVRRYRRRPIYWLFRSPKGSFSALVYLHRYTPDTVPRLLNGYLRQYVEKLRNRRENLLTVSRGADISAGEKNRAIREAERLEKIGAELTAYERDVIYPLATQPLTLDLDDGVLVNYNRFGAALAPVKGLTGKAGGGDED